MNWLVEYLWVVSILLLPLAGFALCLHLLEHFIQNRLAHRFGWRAVLWTGWLGTPIHEFSHVVMCWLFRHRVDEVRLFDPDLMEGRLGYVRHSYRRGNLYEEIGNVWIGTAPLLGGLLILMALTWLFFPAALTVALDESQRIDFAQLTTVPKAIFSTLSRSLGAILKWENVVTARFWVFLYLVLCVASHTAPSRTDYAGAWRGALFLLALLALATLVSSLAGGSPLLWAGIAVQSLTPLWGVAILSLAICTVAAILVGILTTFF